MYFRDIIGQEPIKQRLRQMVEDQRIPHAQLFYGPRGVGKLQMAIAFAQYLACPNHVNGEACGKCPACLQYQKLQHPDLNFVFPIVKNESRDVCDEFFPEFQDIVLSQTYFDINDWYAKLGVETKQGMIYEKESGEILRKLSLRPYGNGFKMMIIWLPEKMNIACANKLLKILEEPPERTLFILVSEEPELLLSTILSRVQQIHFDKVDENEIATALREENEELNVTDSLNLARLGNGSYLASRKLMLNATEQNDCLEQFIALMRQAWLVGHKKDYGALLKLRQWSESMADAKVGRERQKNFLMYTQRLVRENFIMNLHKPNLNYMTAGEEDFSQKFSPYINENNVENIMNELQTAQQQIEQNGNAKIIFFDLCLQMIMFLK